MKRIDLLEKIRETGLTSVCFTFIGGLNKKPTLYLHLEDMLSNQTEAR